ncbi:MAG: 50S ribosomal protein L4 [Bacteroidetes bacterium]|nr:MAG: 50S ribosomal protein L4 [Bacteroidota bacterium]
MKVSIYQQDGTDSGKSVTLDKTVFEIEPNDHAIWLDVRRIQGNARQGTHKTKERGEVNRSTRKLYRQKGTGHARAGSAKSPVRRSGGTIFGPRPHKYHIKVNRKTQLVARRSAWTYKAQNKALRVIEDFSMDAPDTQQLKTLLQSIDVGDKHVLLLTGEHSPAVNLSSRNLPKLKVLNVSDASTLDVMKAHCVVFQKTALKSISTQLGTKKK